MTHDGGCLCGAVRFTCAGAPINVRVCHCRNCQRATAAPFFARALFAHEALTITGETARFASSPALDRMFCPRCGSRLFTWRHAPAVVGVALAAFDDRNAFVPTEHIWVLEKMSWLDLDDGLPQHDQGHP